MQELNMQELKQGLDFVFILDTLSARGMLIIIIIALSLALFFLFKKILYFVDNIKQREFKFEQEINKINIILEEVVKENLQMRSEFKEEIKKDIKEVLRIVKNEK